MRNMKVFITFKGKHIYRNEGNYKKMILTKNTFSNSLLKKLFQRFRDEQGNLGEDCFFFTIRL